MGPASRSARWTWRYTLLGSFIGILVVAVAMLLDIAASHREVSMANLIWAQSRQPALWLVDLAPALLGFAGYLAGRRQDAADWTHTQLEKRFRQVSDANKLLADQMGEREELEEQLRHSQKLEAVGRLAGGVAHDFNNLLTAIIGYADLLLSELGPTDSKREYAEEIHGAGDRAAALVQQLLGFSRKQMIAPKVVDLNVVLDDSRKLLERVIGEDVRLDVIESDYPVNVLIDPVQADQILVNLVVNARDAMPDGGTVTLRAAWVRLEERDCEFCTEARPGDFCLLEVSDTGIGMDEIVLGKIFEPFFTTKCKAKGTGLGLATTYGIVQQNGGFIDVLSHLGDGATFRIYLPLQQPGAEEERRAARSTLTAGSECVLLVEDEQVVRTLASKTLRDRGYEVLEAEHADEAEAIWASRKADVDLLLTDIIMPGKDGKQLSQLLSDDRPDMPILFMSGYDDALLNEHDVSGDKSNFIPKPFSVDTLAGKVREMLDARAV